MACTMARCRACAACATAAKPVRRCGPCGPEEPRLELRSGGCWRGKPPVAPGAGPPLAPSPLPAALSGRGDCPADGSCKLPKLPLCLWLSPPPGVPSCPSLLLCPSVPPLLLRWGARRPPGPPSPPPPPLLIGQSKLTPSSVSNCSDGRRLEGAASSGHHQLSVITTRKDGQAPLQNSTKAGPRGMHSAAGQARKREPEGPHRAGHRSTHLGGVCEQARARLCTPLLAGARVAAAAHWRDAELR